MELKRLHVVPVDMVTKTSEYTLKSQVEDLVPEKEIKVRLDMCAPKLVLLFMKVPSQCYSRWFSEGFQ